MPYETKLKKISKIEKKFLTKGEAGGILIKLPPRGELRGGKRRVIEN
jgi:hypothetical protein